jgi:hypothetical protein
MVLYFKGLGDKATIPNRTAVNNFTDFTFSYWGYFLENGASSTPNIISKNYASANSFINYMSGNVMIWRTVNNTSVSVGTTGFTFDFSKWVFITCTYRQSDGRMDIYYNGLPKQNATNTSVLNGGTVADMLFNANASIKFRAFMRDLKIWRKKLTDQEVLDQFLGIGEDNIPDAWYPMDENTGSPADKILPINTINLASGTNPVKWATLEEVYSDRYLQLDGVNDSITLGVQAGLWSNTTLKKFSFSIWLKFDVLSDGTNHRDIFNKGWAATHGFSCYVLATLNRLEWELVGTTWPTRISSGYTTIDPTSHIGKWINVIITYDYLGKAGNRSIMYVNGSRANFVTATDNVGEILTNASSGVLGGSTNDHDGGIDDFKWWHEVVLTPNQAREVYQNGRKGKPLIPFNALLWDTNTDWVSLGNDTALWSKALNQFSFSFWVKPDALNTGAYQYLVNHGWASNLSFICYFDSVSYSLTFGMKDSAGVQKLAIKTLDATYEDKEFLVTCVFDNTLATGNVKIYVDGVLGATVGTQAIREALNFSAVMTLGASAGSVSFLGTMRDFGWWEIALTQQEILNMVAIDNFVTPPKYWLPMDEGVGNCLDRVSMTKAGVLSGNVWEDRYRPKYALPLIENTGNPIDVYAGLATTLSGATWISNKPTVNDPSYQFSLGMRIKIMSNDETTTYFVYDSNGQKPFKVVNLRFSLGDDETDIAQLMIEDSDDVLDDDMLSGGVKYFISLTMGLTTIYEDLFVGFGDLCEVQANERNKILKMITIYGSSIYEQWRYLNYNRQAKLGELDDPSVINDPDFKAYNHVIRAISSKSELLYDKLIIEDQTGWDKVSISRKVDTIIGGIALGRVTLADFGRFLKSITGASMGVRLRNKKEEFFFEYPTENYIDIILQSGYEKTSNDIATKNSYCYPPFIKTKDTTIDVKHTTVLHGITTLTDQFIAGSKDFAGADSLTFRAIVQYLPLPSDAKRIRQVNFMLSMRGEVTSPENVVRGALYLVDSAGKPKGTKLDVFEIPLSDIKPEPTIVSVAVDVSPDDIKGDSRIAVKLYNRSGTEEIDKGEPNHDESNTILWYHNNKVNQAKNTDYASGQAAEGDRHKEPNLTWQMKDTGPIYACSLFSDIQRIQTVLSPQLFSRYGVREFIIDVSDLKDKTTIINFLHYTAYILSLPKSYINNMRIKIPNNIFFRPNQIMFMNVTKPHIAEQMRIKRVEYNLPMLADQSGVNQSSRICTVTLLGTFNPADQVKFNCEY